MTPEENIGFENNPGNENEIKREIERETEQNLQQTFQQNLQSVEKPEKQTGRRKVQNSIISDLRKEQILEAAAVAVNDSGYMNTSLSKIAKQANISTALISYYFPTKRELTDTLLRTLLKKQEDYIHEKVVNAQTPLEMLYIYIRSYLSYSTMQPQENNALTEIILNARDENGRPYYKATSLEETELLEKILTAIQIKGGFVGMDAKSLAVIILGAVKEYSINESASEKIDYETYCNELIETVSKLSGFSKKYTYEPIINDPRN